MNLIAILIVGASVSSGWSGRPSGEWIADWTNLPYVNEARIAQGLTKFVDDIEIKPNTLVFNLDGPYWDSYNKDCSTATKAIEKFLDKVKGSYAVMATVPDKNAGWFYRFVAAAELPYQNCRTAINETLTRLCVKDCMLFDSDALVYSKRDPDENIHLQPEVWREIAVVGYERMKKEGVLK